MLTNMAAPDNKGVDCWRVPEVYKHHEQRKVCISRPKYREGRKAKAVKVYTINLESCYLMVQGVPAIGVMTELVQLCALYGSVEEYRPLDEYPAEDFSEVYLIKFHKLTSARAAKRNLDEKSFYGGVLHVCYVPEYESVDDTRHKLQDRRGYVKRAAARNRERTRKETRHETPASSDTTPEPDTNISRHDKLTMTIDNDNKGETSNTSHYSGFPLLPLPPQEHYFYGHQNQHGITPTEDRMGTLHDVITDITEQQVESSSFDQTPNNRDKGTEHKLDSDRVSAIRFVPRTKQLENRKRKMEEAMAKLGTVSEENKNKPLIGPKLPEPPKLDMEDESLNTTVSLIRNTMKQVESVPAINPVEKKIKPRRRI
ncbi:RNA-binding protein 48 [Xenentodon cancila]